MASILILDTDDKVALTLEQSFKIIKEDTGSLSTVTRITKPEDLANELQGGAYEVLFIDYTMMDQSPDKWLDNFRKKTGRKDLPVVVTGFETELAKIAKFLEWGYGDYIVKPPDRPLLLEKTLLLATGKRSETRQVYTQATSQHADIADKGAIEELSEFECTVKTHRAYQIGDVITLYSKVFGEYFKEVGAVLCKCTKIVPHPSEKGSNHVSFVYFGVLPTTLKNIRTALRKDYVSKK
ncbi:MAG: hypothetical protein AB7H97_18800, partial [Pseudobdellovibrionaceae bacterium]